MSEYDDGMLIEEILCCQNDDDIRSLVDSQCLDIIGNSIQDQLTLAHKQLFRVIKLFKDYLLLQPCKYWDLIKNKEQNLELQKNNSIIQYELLKEKSKTKQYLEENAQLKIQIKLYEGDFETIRQQNFEDIKKVEEQLNKTLNSISLYKNSLIQKFCVICLQKEYCIMFKPCGHVCVCENCSLQIDQCPVDRQKIRKMKKVYLS